MNCALYTSELYEDNKKETLQRLQFKQSFLAGFLVHFNFPEKKMPLFYFSLCPPLEYIFLSFWGEMFGFLLHANNILVFLSILHVLAYKYLENFYVPTVISIYELRNAQFEETNPVKFFFQYSECELQKLSKHLSSCPADY